VIKVNFCRSCGVNQAENSKFCSSCGKTLAGVAKPIESKQSRPSFRQFDRNGDVPKPKDEGWYYTKWVWVWLILFWPIGLYGLSKRVKPEDKMKLWGGIAALFVIIIIFDGGKSNNSGSGKNYAKENLYASCLEIGLMKIRDWNAFDYDRERFSATSNGNVSVLLRHEKFSGRYLRCLYDSKTNSLEWNTALTSGSYNLPKDYASSSMTLNFN
jgi:hypothetical protein